MGFLDRLKLGGLALQVARHAGLLLARIGAEALKRILREVVRLEIDEPHLTGRQKFAKLTQFVRTELAEAVDSLDLTDLLVSALVELFKRTGLFQPRKLNSD